LEGVLHGRYRSRKPQLPKGMGVRFLRLPPYKGHRAALPIACIEPAASPLCPVALQDHPGIGGANNGVGDEAVSCELKASFAPLTISIDSRM